MYKKIIFIVLCFILIVGITACGKKEDVQSDLVSQLKNYISDFNDLNDTTIDAYYNPKEYKMLDSDVNGVLSSVIYDFDNDGEEEAIVFLVNNNKISLELLKKGNDDINKIMSLDIMNELPTADKYNLNIFSYKLGGKVTIFVEIKGYYSLLTDGVSYSLLPISIENGKLSKKEEINLAGSYLPYNESSEYMNKVRQFGLNVTTLDESILEQNDDAVRICSILKEHLSDFVIEDYYNSKEEKVKYGYISFKNYIGSNFLIELKDFASDWLGEENTNTNFDNSYLGRYTFNSGNNTLYLELSNDENEVKYILSYYPNGSMHASEELWGIWNTEVNNMYAINENLNSLATYYFSKIKYVDGKIEFDIKVKDIIIDDYKDYVIPDGSYVFIK